MSSVMLIMHVLVSLSKTDGDWVPCEVPAISASEVASARACVWAHLRDAVRANRGSVCIAAHSIVSSSRVCSMLSQQPALTDQHS